MRRSLRQSLNLMHTWAGILLGALLFLIFFMGSLSVFDEEIDRWMMPDTRGEARADVGYDTVLANLLPAVEVRDEPVFLYPPSQRQPVYRANFHGPGDTHLRRFLDPATGELLPDQGTLGASEFFYPMHFGLHLDHFGFTQIGYWLVGIAGMAMLALLVSGVIIHRRIFRDFFTFRLERSRGRALLDLHNVAGVMLLPFLLVITFSGIVIFSHVYMPAGILAVYPDPDTFFHDAFPHPDREAAGESAQTASLDTMADRASREWGGGELMALGLFHPGDANGYVAMYKDTGDQVSYRYEQLTFDAASGELMHHQRLGPAMSTYQFIMGLHLAKFDDWPLMWLYFLMGLGGCLVIATGFLVWLDKRVRDAGRAGYRAAQATASAATVGLLLATAAMLAANRLLPADMAGRAAAEVWVFFGAWGASLLFGLWRPGLTNLRRQLQALALLSLSLPLLNAATTGDHLAATLWRGDWVVAGVDLCCLAATAMAWLGARRLPAPVSGPVARPATSEA
ncbi:PepSY-associated TM helix domain-containing protein [Salinisphaera sp. PC39]|uniref:PepSY-associated TM helix domain-containing protein n=1 Tax=Salinisphaera sp. PC39 TaxID=1304156 RepID=UPI003341DA7D